MTTWQVVENFGGIPGILTGTLAARPAPNPATDYVGRLYIVSSGASLGNVYRDNGTSWEVIAGTPVQATETVVGGGEVATQTETDTGTDDTRIVTPLKLAASDMFRLQPTEVSVTGATTLTSTAFGKLHVLTNSAYTVTLPAASGNAGKVIGFRVGPAVAGVITIDGNGSELVDGLLAKVVGQGESVVLECDATGWHSIASSHQRRPGLFAATHNASQTGIVTSTFTKVILQTEAVDLDGWFVPGATAVDALSRYTPKRRGYYLFTGSVLYATAADQTAVRCLLYKNGSQDTGLGWTPASGTSFVAVGGTAVAHANGTTDYFEMFTHQASGSNKDLAADGGFNRFSGFWLGE